MARDIPLQLRLRRLRRVLLALVNPRFGLAILMSGIFWIGVTLDRNPTTMVTIPGNIAVDPVGVADGLVLVSDVQPIQVSVRGPSESLNVLTTRDFVARVDLTGFDDGLHLLPVSVETADPRVEIQKVTPEEISIQLDSRIVLAVPVRLILRGEPAEGFRTDDVIYEPQAVEILGAETAVRQVSALQADVELTGVNATVSRQVSGIPVNDSGEEVQGVQAATRLIDVVVPVNPVTVRKTVPVRAQVVGVPSAGNLANRYDIAPSSVEIEGSPGAVESVDQILIEPVDIGGATEDVSADVNLIVPEGITLIRGSLEVSVNINLTAIDGTASFVVGVMIADVADGLIPSVSTASMQVVLVGSAERLAALEIGDIRAEVSMAGRTVGTHEVRPVILSPVDTELQSVAPETVVVTLEAEIIPEDTPTPTPTPRPTATPVPTAAPVISDDEAAPPGVTFPPTPAPGVTPSATATPVLLPTRTPTPEPTPTLTPATEPTASPTPTPTPTGSPP